MDQTLTINDELHSTDNDKSEKRITSQETVSFVEVRSSRRKRLIYSIVAIILIVVIAVSVPTIIVTTKKKNVTEVSTTTIKAAIFKTEILTTTKTTTESMILTTETLAKNVHPGWKQDGITVAGGSGQVNPLSMLSYPGGIDIDSKLAIYAAERGTHRVIKWKLDATMGEVVAGDKGAGDRPDQLSSPSDVVIDKKTNTLVICDTNRLMRVLYIDKKPQSTIILSYRCGHIAIDHNGTIYMSDFVSTDSTDPTGSTYTIKRWNEGELHPIIVAGGNEYGNALNQLYNPSYLFVDQDYSIYISDTWNHRVMKWAKGAKKGVIIAGGQGPGDSLTQLNKPAGLIVDSLNNIYVIDSKNHRIMRFSEGSRQGTVVVGGNGYGRGSNQFDSPADLAFDKKGNLYVSDTMNQRIQKFYLNN
ncbi:unnamed protein product [Adineta ricciae]|uniref:Uncharacterized protein n=1 Tax=Adineta ricciae TaxID=249248 RepID=A0A815NYL9_ADIRI|nr:unnamed protein product [Adineta ricciae]CAF1441441.1 unnamed protein product [Adineta ricciae]